MKRRTFLSTAGLLISSPAVTYLLTNPVQSMTTNQTPAPELISHHLCPFLHRSAILLERKGLHQGTDFTVTRLPIYNFPQWLYTLSPKGSTPILRLADQRVLLHSVAFNAYLDETITPEFFPADAYQRAVHRGLILDCGDLLTEMRKVYTSKDQAVMDKAMGQLFTGLKEIEADLTPMMNRRGQADVQMVECAFGPLFTLILAFERLKTDARWESIPAIRQYADQLVADPIVVATKSPNYYDEFDKFFNYFGSAFKLIR